MVVERFVFRVGIDMTGKPLMILADEAQERLFPIWIGPFEAQAIQMALDGEKPVRPLSHDLLVNTLAALGYQITDIAVTRLEDQVFYAELVLQGENGPIRVDARPSDAVALALRTGARIWVEEEVLIQAEIPNEEAEQWQADRLRELLEDVPIPESDELDQTDEENNPEKDDTED